MSSHLRMHTTHMNKNTHDKYKHHEMKGGMLSTSDFFIESIKFSSVTDTNYHTSM